MVHRKNSVVLAVVVGALCVLSTACSALTRSEEITISAEPAAAKVAVNMPAPTPAPQAPMQAGDQGG